MVLFEDEVIEGSYISKKVIIQYEDFDWDDNSNFEDDFEITDNNKDIFNVDAFIKLMKATHNSGNFKSYKILFLHSFHLSSQ